MLESILQKQLKPREKITDLLKWLEDEQMLLVTGSRQVGKTHLLYLLIQHFVKSGITKNRIFYLDLEDLEFLNLLNSGVNNFISYLTSKGLPQDEKTFVFIDEIQYLDNPSNLLKILCDHYKNIKLICTGSSTLQIKKKFKDSLAGRKIVFELHSLNFREFLIFKEREDLLPPIKPFSILNIKDDILIHSPEVLNAIKIELIPFFNEYVSYGGYPAVALENEFEKKQILLNEIYQTYIRKDIGQIFDIENISAFNNLTRLLAIQIGTLHNSHRFTTALGISRQTLEKYVFILENTFIIKPLPPYYKNKAKEITKMPKIYFFDIGLRNNIIKNHQEPRLRTDLGFLIENHIFSTLNNNIGPLTELRFWRTKTKNEVDFILITNNPIPIEAKYQEFDQPRIPSGIRHFSIEYHPQFSIIITYNYLNKIIHNKQPILFIPAWLIN